MDDTPSLTYTLGSWHLYDMSEDYTEPDLCQIVEIVGNCYVLKMYTHGYVFPGITIVQREFERASIPLSDKDAMLEILKREIT